MGQSTAVETGRATAAYFDELDRTWEFELLRTLLGLQPIAEQLATDPAMSTSIEQINLFGVPGRWGRADAIGRGRLSPELGPW